MSKYKYVVEMTEVHKKSGDHNRRDGYGSQELAAPLYPATEAYAKGATCYRPEKWR